MTENLEKEFYSCNIIEHGFDAQMDSINLCCRVGNEGNQTRTVLFPNYSGEKIDWDSFFNITGELRSIQRNGGTIPQCQNCIYLEKKNWDDEKYITSININNWIKCNARCIYCERKYYENKKEYNIFPIINDLIKKNYLRNPVDITIAGGEPTITSDFDKTIKLLIKNNISTVRVLTNAIKYNKYIEEGLKKGLVNISVSTDSGTRETYKKIKLVDKHYDVWKNIKKYASIQKEKSLVKTKYIIIPSYNSTKKEIVEFFKRNIEAGVTHTYIDVEINWFRLKCSDKELLDKLYNLFLFAKQIGEKCGITVEAFDRIRIIENQQKE